MSQQYSLNEAKAKLSELVRQVREGGQAVTITLYGRPVAELRRLDPEAEPKTTAERHAELERAGHIHRVQGTADRTRFPLGVRRPGALKRFLTERRGESSLHRMTGGREPTAAP